MAASSDVTAWIALFLGFHWLAVSVGELRSPNWWWMMLKELERSPALRFLVGVVALAIGAAVYLVNPWTPGDWLSIGVSAIGGLHVAQGLLTLASGERFLHLARAVIGRGGRALAGFGTLAGAALVLFALARLQTF